MPIIIYRTRNKQFRYKVTGKNNEVLVFSETMKTKQAIKKGIEALVVETKKTRRWKNELFDWFSEVQDNTTKGKKKICV